MAIKVIFLTTTGAGTWNVPADWTNVNEIGTLAAGAGGRTASAGAGAGGGGQFRKLTNVNTYTPGSTVINFSVGAAGSAGVAGGDTWWDGTTFANAALKAQGGQTSAGTAGGAGGSTGTGGTGFNGGAGGVGSTGALTGGGGGGAAGPGGAGGLGGNGDTSTTGADFGGSGGGGAGLTGAGGTGGNGSTSAGAVGTAGTGGGGPGGAGGSGAGLTPAVGSGVWTSTHAADATTPSVATAAPGGGGGGSGSTAAAPGNGANYGAGGGGKGATAGGASNGSQGIIVISYTVPDHTLTQGAYRFYADGTESGSVADAAENTNVAINPYTRTDYLLRVRLQETGGGAGASTDDYKLQYSVNGGTYTDVTTSSAYIQAFGSSNLTDAGATTNRLSVGSGSFVAGKISEDGTVDDLNITASNYTELLYTLRLVAADLHHTDTLDFRVVRNGATTGMTYSVTPRITAQGNLGTQQRRGRSWLLNGATSDLSGGGASSRTAIESGTVTSGTWAPSLGSLASAYASFFTPSGVPGVDGTSSGALAVLLNVTTQNTNLRLSVQLHRVNSSGTVQASGLKSAEQVANAGIIWFDAPIGLLGTWSSGDRLRVDVHLRNATTNTSQSATITTSNTSTTTDVICSGIIWSDVANPAGSWAYGIRTNGLVWTNSNKTVQRNASQVGTDPHTNVASTDAVLDGQTGYAELTFDHPVNHLNLSVGVGTRLTPLQSYLAINNPSESHAAYGDGSLYINDTTGVDLGTNAVDGTIYCVSIRRDITPHRLWWRKNNGSWNASGTANPSTNVGGIDISQFGTVPLYLFASMAGSDVDNTEQISLNTGSAAFTYTQPASVNKWDGSDVGGATLSGDGASAGTSTATAVGLTIIAGAGSAAGTTPTANAGGAATVAGAGSAAGTTPSANAASAATAAAAGAAAGTSTVAGISQATGAAVGATAGTSTAAAVGVAVAAGAGVATGTSSVAGALRADARFAGSAAGTTPTANAVGGGTFASVGAAAGTVTVTAGSTALAQSVGSATGTSTVAAGGTGIKATVGSAAGTSSVNGRTPSLGTGSAAGTTVTANAVAVWTAAASGAAAGTSNVTGAFRTTAAAAGAAAGSSTVAAVGAATSAGVGSSTGTSTATAVGSYQAAGVGTGIAAGSGSAAASMVATGRFAGAAAGTVVVTAVGRATVAAVGAAAGTSTATGIQGPFKGTGAAAGTTPTAAATGRATTAAAGAAAGSTTAQAAGATILKGAGNSAGTSTAAAVGSTVGSGAMMGSAAGTSAVAAVGASTRAATGAAAGTSAVTGIGLGTNIQSGTGAAAGSTSALGFGVGFRSGVGFAAGFATAHGIMVNLTPPAGAAGWAVVELEPGEYDPTVLQVDTGTYDPDATLRGEL